MFKKWIAENAPWLGAMLMAFLGGFVAHVRAYEKSNMSMSLADHVKGFIVRSVYAAMAGLIVYFLFEAAVSYGYKVSEPLVFVTAAVCGMFGAEFFDFIFKTGQDIARKRLGLQPENRDDAAR
jgi:putative Mn2+ efflux pump MntP